MSWTLIASAIVTDGNTITLNTTGADLIVIIGNNNANGNNPPTDNKGNTWLVARNQANTNGGRANCQIFYAQAPTVGTGHQFSKTAAFGCLAVLAYSGSVSNPLDQTNGQTISGGTADQAGPITPTQNLELVVFACALDSPALGATPTVDTGFTLQGFIDFGAGQYGMAVSTLVQSTAVSINPTLTRATAGGINDCCAIVSFFGVQPPPPTTTGGGRQVWEQELDDLTLASHKWHQRLIEANPFKTGEEISRIASELGKRGGHARAQTLTAKQRSDIASKAASTRWQ